MRCASPPESVGAARSSCRYPSPTRSRNFTRARSETQAGEELLARGDGFAGERGDRALAEAHIERGRIEPLTLAVRAALRLVRVPLVPPQLLAALLGIESGHLHARAVAALAPAVLGVEGEQTRVQFREALAAGRAG